MSDISLQSMHSWALKLSDTRKKHKMYCESCILDCSSVVCCFVHDLLGFLHSQSENVLMPSRLGLECSEAGNKSSVIVKLPEVTILVDVSHVDDVHRAPV